jgi:hypothetical protein
MSDDVVKWLRIMEEGYRFRGGSGAEDFKLAADTIERLRAEVDKSVEVERKLLEDNRRAEEIIAEKDRRIEELEEQVEMYMVTEDLMSRIAGR